jgi:uncharacterized protein YecT (DUF1311 family)
MDQGYAGVGAAALVACAGWIYLFYWKLRPKNLVRALQASSAGGPDGKPDEQETKEAVPGCLGLLGMGFASFVVFGLLGNLLDDPQKAKPKPPKAVQAEETAKKPARQALPDRATAETRINAVYRKLTEKLDVDARRRTTKAELAWIAFKDADVAFVRRWRGDRASSARYVEMTTQRADRLDAAYASVAGLPPRSATFVSTKSYGDADAELNSAYKRLLPKLDARSRKALVSAQLAWIAFRDAEADACGDWSRDSGARETCLATLTELRTRELQVLAH